MMNDPPAAGPSATAFVNRMGSRVDYPCGCSASGGLVPLPQRCPIHGDRDQLRDAAPDLLAAAKNARCGCSMSEIDSGHTIGCWMPEMSAAITKAEGR